MLSRYRKGTLVTKVQLHTQKNFIRKTWDFLNSFETIDFSPQRRYPMPLGLCTKHFEQFVIAGYQPLCKCTKITLRTILLLPPHLFLNACVAIYASLCVFRTACTVTPLRNTLFAFWYSKV